MRFQHKHNRGWAIVLLIALVLFAGCNAASPADPSTQTTRPVPQANQGQSADPAWLEVTHTTRQIAGTQEITYTVAPVCTSFAPLEGLTELAAYQGKLLGAGYRVNEYLIAMGQLFQVDPAMGTLELFGPSLQPEESFYEVAVNPQGEIWTVLGKSYMDLDTQQYCTDYYLAAVSEQGIPGTLIPLPDLTDAVEFFSYSGIFRLCFADDGTMLLDCGGVLLRFDQSGTYLGYVTPSYPVYSFGSTSEGRLYLAIPGETGTVVQEISSEGAILSELRLETVEDLLLLPSQDGAMVTGHTQNALVQFQGNSGALERTLPLLELGLQSLDMQSLFSLGDQFYFLGSGQLDEGVYCLEPLETPQTRTVLSYATMDSNDPLLNAISSFNRSSNDFVLEVWDYSEAAQGDGARFIQALHQDILAGNTPDLANFYGIAWEGLLASDLLVELSPYLAESDILNSETLLPGVLEGMEVNTGLYTMPATIALVSAYGKAAALREPITFAQAPMERQTLFAPMDRISYLTAFYGFGCPETVSWQTALEHLPEPEGETPAYITVREEHALLGLETFDSFSDFHVLESYLLQTEAALIGFPDAISHSPAIQPMSEVAIFSGSQHRDGAWSFLEFLCGEAGQAELSSGFPIRVKSLQALAAACLEEPEGGDLSDYVVIDGTRYNAVPMTEAAIERYLAWITQAHTRFRNDPTVCTILDEELPAFLHGDKDAAEAGALIEERIDLYLAEAGS